MKGGKDVTESFYKTRGFKITAVTAAILAAVLMIPVILRAGIEIVGATYTVWTPDYEMIDLLPILEKEELSDEDYDTVFEQTGLTRIAVDDYLSRGLKGEILRIQRYFFEEPDYYCHIFHFCVGMIEKSEGRYPNALLQDGDIIYSPSTYISFVNISHAAIVVDGEIGLLAEAYGYGSVIKTCTAASFFTYPQFVILRPKADAALREEVADFVREELLGTPYDIFTGIFGEKAPVPLETTHCSHMPWYAYYRHGIDLDSNGGKIVTPYDILKSPYLEVVQVFGMDINDFR